MTLPKDPKPLKGVARSLDDLFTQAAPAPAPVAPTPAPAAPKPAVKAEPVEAQQPILRSASDFPLETAPPEAAPPEMVWDIAGMEMPPAETAPAKAAPVVTAPVVAAPLAAPPVVIAPPSVETPPPPPVVAAPAPPPAPEPPPVVAAAAPTPAPEHEIAEGPLLDADVLVEEIAGPTATREQPDPEEERRARVRVAMDSLEHGVDALIAGEGDPDSLGRHAIEDATILRDENALEPIVDAVERLARVAPDDPVDVASEVARQISSRHVLAALALRVAGVREDERRDELIRSCRSLGEPAAVALAMSLAKAEDRHARSNLVHALVQMEEHGLKQAEIMVQPGTAWGLVRNGVAILGELGGERAVEHLMETVEHEHPKVRCETLSALARVGGEGANLLVIGKLEDPDEEVRTNAVRAAATLRSGRTVKVLLKRLDEEASRDVQVEILKALGQLGDPVAVPTIEKKALGGFMKRPSVEMRIAAYRALAAIGTPHARQLVEAAAEDKDPEVKSVARQLMAAEREARKQQAAAKAAAKAEAQSAEESAAATPAGAPAQGS